MDIVLIKAYTLTQILDLYCEHRNITVQQSRSEQRNNINFDAENIILVAIFCFFILTGAYKQFISIRKSKKRRSNRGAITSTLS